MNIYLPNQWFYIASFFTEYYNELQKYKQIATELFSTERLKTLKGSSLSADEKKRLNKRLSVDNSIFVEKFVTDYDWWGGGKTIDRTDFYVSPILNYARLVNATQSYVADLCAFLAENNDLVSILYNTISEQGNTSRQSLSIGIDSFKNHPRQQIFYGAPGTGKSHEIKENENVKTADEKNLVFRTTFHPDSDYSTFVGAYKPTMRPVADKYKAVAGKDEEITYSFVPQAFLQAYVAAWNNPDDKVFLVIEEINRGNCAQIFGDLFQLLDRDCDGFSEYPIMADKDLAKYLNSKDENGKDVLTNKDGIKDGKLRLPSNLYIWATMNTSDQSLFPIDSAFKRRWDWKYLPIENADKGWKIQVNGHEYDWYEFLETINREVYDLTHSEDKQLGYFFAKAKNEVVDAETLVNKVYFYLWTDVFKDYDIESQKAFKKPNSNEAIAFRDFFVKGGVNEEMAEQVLVNLGLEKQNKSGELFG